MGWIRHWAEYGLRLSLGIRIMFVSGIKASKKLKLDLALWLRVMELCDGKSAVINRSTQISLQLMRLLRSVWEATLWVCTFGNLGVGTRVASFRFLIL